MNYLYCTYLRNEIAVNLFENAIANDLHYLHFDNNVECTYHNAFMIHHKCMYYVVRETILFIPNYIYYSLPNY
jgi:hypothetical protein